MAVRVGETVSEAGGSVFNGDSRNLNFAESETPGSDFPGVEIVALWRKPRPGLRQVTQQGVEAGMPQDCQWRAPFEVRVAESEQQGGEVCGVVGVVVSEENGGDLVWTEP